MKPEVAGAMSRVRNMMTVLDPCVTADLGVVLGELERLQRCAEMHVSIDLDKAELHRIPQNPVFKAIGNNSQSAIADSQVPCCERDHNRDGDCDRHPPGTLKELCENFRGQIHRLHGWLQKNAPEELTGDEGAVATAIRLLSLWYPLLEVRDNHSWGEFKVPGLKVEVEGTSNNQHPTSNIEAGHGCTDCGLLNDCKCTEDRAEVAHSQSAIADSQPVNQCAGECGSGSCDVCGKRGEVGR